MRTRRKGPPGALSASTMLNSDSISDSTNLSHYPYTNRNSTKNNDTSSPKFNRNRRNISSSNVKRHHSEDSECYYNLNYKSIKGMLSISMIGLTVTTFLVLLAVVQPSYADVETTTAPTSIPIPTTTISSPLPTASAQVSVDADKERKTTTLGTTTTTLNPTTTAATTSLCRVENGLSSIIVDIPESIGDQMDQSTSPRELPVIGDPYDQIELSLKFPDSKRYFGLVGKRLELNEPLDRDADDISSIVFQLVCTIRATGDERSIPVIVRVSDINDNSPKFGVPSYEVSIPESAPVGTTVFRSISAHDVDSGVNGLVEYFIVDSDEEKPQENGYGVFSINLPHQGAVTLNRTLDYEKTQKYYVTIVASDRAFDPKNRRSSTTTLTVNILDTDDQPPNFQLPCKKQDGFCVDPIYEATVTRGTLSGVLDVRPERILAVDKDTLHSPIQYSFVTGSPPNFVDYFHIDASTGVVRQIRPIDNDQDTRFDIILKAVEVTPAKRFATARLIISVHAVDSHPPIIQASSLVGYTEENAALGTVVLSLHDHRPIVFSVTDPDLTPNDPRPNYQYELTTTAFRVNEEGVLVVNEEHLDRDPPHPSELHFQMIAREIGFGQASSSPLVMTVRLLDRNDNPPVLPRLAPVTISGGDGRRIITQIEAEDNDEGVNAQIRYSLHHISNNGKDKFVINETTGILESVGKLNSGEQYSLTVQAMDGGGRSTQEILEVNVINGPNLKAPSFPQLVYDVAVSEGASVGAEVITLEAKDPEGKAVIYEIIGGNELKHFTIGKNNGILTVNGQLDREDLGRYSLTIKGEDEGGLFTTTTVNIRVIDINDRNPEWINLPYEFTVKEGVANQIIGRIEAKDADELENGEIRYEAPPDSPIAVDPMTGDVSTKVALDYEKQRVHHVVVTAKDMAQDSRIATATVTVRVEDKDDEAPMFNRFVYEVSIPENFPNTKVTRVEAIDPDTVKKITYYIKQGPFDKFSIDSFTGDIYTTQGLDYERDNKHILIVGTEENDSGNVGATTTVIIHVEDQNDIPPIFNVVPRPIRLEDTSRVGMVITKLEATDGDGTPPGNKVKYDLVGRGKASRYFDVDHDTGVVTIKDDLRKEMDTEYQIDVRAYDLGEPQLFSVATVKVYVDHVATVPPDVGVGFAEVDYYVEISESAAAGKVLKTLTIVNKPNEMIPLQCAIVSGNEDGLFEVKETEDRNCVLILTRAQLDYEKKTNYQVQVQLTTLPGVISKKRSKTTISVKVIDENDNKPEFIFPDYQKVARGKKFFAAISEDAQISTSIIHMKAEDKDSGSLREIAYELESENPLARSYFTIDSRSGIVSNTRTIDDISPSLLPFRLTVMAKDNPNGNSQGSQVPLILNVINEPHRMILVIQGTTPDKVKSKEKDILDILQDSSNLIIGIEKITAHRYLSDNGTLESDPTATDVWFYAVDPISDYILDREHPKVAETIMSRDGSKTISYYVSSSLGVRATEVRKPITRAPLPPAPVGPLENDHQWAAFPAALVALAGLIFIVGVGGICFICYKWSRYTAYKNQVQRIVVSPRYEPVYMEHSPSLKEYETQVLQMRVNGEEPELGDDSDLQIDMNLNRNHVYNIESAASYLKDNILGGGRNSPSCHTEGHLARQASDYNYQPDLASASKTPILKTFQHHVAVEKTIDPSVTNPIYERSDDEDGVISITSRSNENVHFKGRFLNKSGPIISHHNHHHPHHHLSSNNKTTEL